MDTARRVSTAFVADTIAEVGVGEWEAATAFMQPKVDTVLLTRTDTVYLLHTDTLDTRTFHDLEISCRIMMYAKHVAKETYNLILDKVQEEDK